MSKRGLLLGIILIALGTIYLTLAYGVFKWWVYTPHYERSWEEQLDEYLWLKAVSDTWQIALLVLSITSLVVGVVLLCVFLRVVY